MKTHKMAIWDGRRGGTGCYGYEGKEKIKKVKLALQLNLMTF